MAVRQATTRLEAELLAAGFAVDLDETAVIAPSGEVESGASPAFISITVLRGGTAESKPMSES